MASPTPPGQLPGQGLTAAPARTRSPTWSPRRTPSPSSGLRRGGAILIGLTNMPAMANGGMQRGLYGRAENSPRKFLTAAFGSGSSNSSGHSATAASFAAFGLGRPGPVVVPRRPTTRCARTPVAQGDLSAGQLAVGPHHGRRCTAYPHDGRHGRVLDVIVADDADTRGDLWRNQPWIAIPAASKVRPGSYQEIIPTDTAATRRYWRASDSVFPVCTSTPTLKRWRGLVSAGPPGSASRPTVGHRPVPGRGRRPDRRRG